MSASVTIVIGGVRPVFQAEAIDRYAASSGASAAAGTIIVTTSAPNAPDSAGGASSTSSTRKRSNSGSTSTRSGRAGTARSKGVSRAVARRAVCIAASRPSRVTAIGIDSEYGASCWTCSIVPATRHPPSSP